MEDTGTRLRRLRLTDEPEAERAHAELGAEGFAFLPDRSRAGSFAAYLVMLERMREGRHGAPDRVTSTLLVAEAGGALVGRSWIRHELNDALRQQGGHVGFAVRPGWRRRGHATSILRESLAFLAGLGVDPALVTCDDDNVGSATVIERCGGVLAGKLPQGLGQPLVRRYWAPTAAREPGLADRPADGA